jgi:hypothetical protein
MKVKIGTKIYNEEDEPILVIIDSEEKKLIKNMSKDAYKYCSYPDNMAEDVIVSFMKV